MIGKLPATRKQFDDLVKPIDRRLLAQRVQAGLGLFGGIFALISVVVWLLPSEQKASPTPGNSSVPSSTLVAGFARDFVVTYLTSKSGDEEKLARFVTVKDVKLPAIANDFTDADIAFVKQVNITRDGVAVWTVTVSGVINGKTAGNPNRTFYRVPITVLDGGLRATDLPMQVAGPGVGVDFKTGYRRPVTLDSQLGLTALGFVRSYLTGGADFSRYVTTGSPEKPIIPAPYVRVDAIRIDADVPSDGAGATTAEVHVEVMARAKNYTAIQLAYPLSLRSVEGRWQVTSIATTPVLQLHPESHNDNESPSTTSSTPTPTPTRG